jgi:3''-phosphoadenosine 5''-phosphosulfate sulfotransferase (PAPS reductase)/FAD synthetase and related enzymes
MRPDYQMSQLDVLEAEAIHIMREVAAEFERPALLFSGGKDSIVMLALAEKAFWPARIPFPVMHVDTGHNFPEVLEFRDRRVASSASGWWWRRCRSPSTRAGSPRKPAGTPAGTGCRP